MSQNLPQATKTFLIVSEVVHKLNDRQTVGAYAPYVREMNLWTKHFDKIKILAPVSYSSFDALDIPFDHSSIELVPVPFIDFTSVGKAFRSLLAIPGIKWKLFSQMRKADHIHLRCPASISLLGCFMQIFFPSKNKTAKYAGNWDWKSHQPISYRIQQYILKNTVLSKRMKVLVYGKWPQSTKNIIPFFTASYSIKDIKETLPRPLKKNEKILIAYVGNMSHNKQPLLVVQAVKTLVQQGLQVELHMFGDGELMTEVKHEVDQNDVRSNVQLHGKQSPLLVKDFLSKAHFLLFVSKSEGWPKVVAEAMFWGCVPVTTAVSCVPQMIGINQRGMLVKATVPDMVTAVQYYLDHPAAYENASTAAMQWSRQYTLEKLDEEISKLLHED